jgi:hypothetical protein
LDAQDLADILTSDNDLEYYEKQLSKDPRRNNTKGDIVERYNNYRKYESSQLARDVNKVVKLLPPDQEVQIKELRSGLNAYGFDLAYQNKILREAGINHKNVRARRNSYEHENGIDKIYLRRID